MAEDVGKLKLDPLFLGLTRPPMMLGVTYSWFMLEFLIWSIVFINTKDFVLVIPGAAGTHLLGFLVCQHEPRFVELWMVWARTWPKCTNRKYHGNTASYDQF